MCQGGITIDGNTVTRDPDGSIVMIVINDTFSTGSFNIQYKGRASIGLPPGAAGTFIWKP